MVRAEDVWIFLRLGRFGDVGVAFLKPRRRTLRKLSAFSVTARTSILPSQLRAAGLRLCDLRYMYKSTGR